MMELVAAAGAGALVTISAAVQHANTVWFKGPGFVLTDRAAPLPRDGFAGRAARALQNNMESAGMYVPVALALALSGGLNQATSFAALTYLAARVVFTLSYWGKINMLRSAAWGVGMASITATVIFGVLDLISV